MRRIAYTIITLLTTTTLYGQVPEGIILDARDSSAMAIIARYSSDDFDSDRHLIEHWMPMSEIEKLYPLKVIGETPNILTTSPLIRVSTPTFRDYNSVKLRFGTNGSLRVVISNGSAYNYMTWPNSPAGYRDARTLSFPVPR